MKEVHQEQGKEHGQDAHATIRGTGVSPVNPEEVMKEAQQEHEEEHGQDAHATQGAHAAKDAHATQGAPATPDARVMQDEVGLEIRQGAYLPHWTRENATYAVTFRLHDSMPREVLEQWSFERERLEKVARQQGRELTESEQWELQRLHSEKIERYLNAGHGACYMKDRQVAEVVAHALKHFDGERYDLFAWCVMPNHVHCVLRTRESHSLPDILHSWKSYTAKTVNRLLSREGRFWQEEYYDHLIRDERDFYYCVQYVMDNPASAGLDPWEWVGGSLSGMSGTGVL